MGEEEVSEAHEAVSGDAKQGDSREPSQPTGNRTPRRGEPTGSRSKPYPHVWP